MNPRYSALRTSLRTAAIMIVFTLLFTAVMAFTYDTTRPAIEASKREEQLRLINEVLPQERYDNALLTDAIMIDAADALGPGGPKRAWRARKSGQPVALVLEASAADGYAGRIELIVAVGSDGAVAGVRVTAHKETPGLGDYIDPRKDRNRERPWIGQFTNLSWAGLEAAKWTVRKDGGAFDYHTGATISARAVTTAVGRAVAYATAHADALFAAPAGGSL